MSFSEFYNNYICLNLNKYPNLEIDFEINKFLAVTLFGIIAAIIMINYLRSSVYLTASKLIRHEAIGEENAMTLSQLGLDLGRVKRCLQSNSQLRSIVARVGEEKLTYEEYKRRVAEHKKAKKRGSVFEKIDFSSARFYIKRDALNVARDLSFKNRSVILNTVLFCALSTIVVVCLIFLMPELLSWLNSLLA